MANEQAVEVDVAKRKELVNRMQAILAEDLPAISLYVPEQISFVDDKKFKGFAYTTRPAGVPSTGSGSLGVRPWVRRRQRPMAG